MDFHGEEWEWGVRTKMNKYVKQRRVSAQINDASVP
jgi:hypothetical protein